jgi:hypothetical protein
MDTRTRSEVIAAYNRRRKGPNHGTFVDRTRTGAYLEINKASGHVRQLTCEEYRHSVRPKYEDGVLTTRAQPDDDSSQDDDDESCPGCGRTPCQSAHGIDCE